MEGFFEKNFTPRAQFELLTLFVWVSALILFIAGIKHFLHGPDSVFRIILPFAQLLPWLGAKQEQKKWLKPDGGEGGSRDPLLTQAVLRTLWGSYILLVSVEYALY